MKKFLLLLIALLVATALFGQWLLNDAGYVLISRGHWRLETSLGLLLLAVLFAFVAFYVTFLLLGWSWSHLRPAELSYRWGHYWSKKRWLRGVASLSKGDFKQAEFLFVAAGRKGQFALGAGLGAAYCAYRQGKETQMADYLTALESHPQGGLFSRWLRLRWLADLGSQKDIASELEELVAHYPDNVLLRELAAELAVKEERWQDLRRHGKQNKGLPEEQAKQLWLGELEQILQQTLPSADKLSQLSVWWKRVAKSHRADADLVVAYANGLLALSKTEQALSVLSQAIEQAWDDRYEPVLWALSADEPDEFLLKLDIWSKHYAHQPVLLLLAGRVAMRAKLWGRAEALFTQAAHAGSVPAWAELARLKQAQGDAAAVQQYLIAQSKQVTGHLPALPLPK